MTTAIEHAERLYAALDGDDIGPVLDLCLPDATVEYPAERRISYGGTWRGREAIAEFLERHEAAEEILVFEPRELLAVGTDTVVAIGHFEGRARASGMTWQTEFVHVLGFADGRLSRWRSFFDTAAALAARGGGMAGEEGFEPSVS